MDKNDIEKKIYEVYEYKEIKDIDGKYFDEMKNINIESPLFKLLSKTKILEKYLEYIFHKKF